MTPIAAAVLACGLTFVGFVVGSIVTCRNGKCLLCEWLDR